MKAAASQTRSLCHSRLGALLAFLTLSSLIRGASCDHHVNSVAVRQEPFASTVPGYYVLSASEFVDGASFPCPPTLEFSATFSLVSSFPNLAPFAGCTSGATSMSAATSSSGSVLVTGLITGLGRCDPVALEKAELEFGSGTNGSSVDVLIFESTTTDPTPTTKCTYRETVKPEATPTTDPGNGSGSGSGAPLTLPDVYGEYGLVGNATTGSPTAQCPRVIGFNEVQGSPQFSGLSCTASFSLAAQSSSIVVQSVSIGFCAPVLQSLRFTFSRGANDALLLTAVLAEQADTVSVECRYERGVNIPQVTPTPTLSPATRTPTPTPFTLVPFHGNYKLNKEDQYGGSLLACSEYVFVNVSGATSLSEIRGLDCFGVLDVSVSPSRTVLTGKVSGQYTCDDPTISRVDIGLVSGQPDPRVDIEMTQSNKGVICNYTTTLDPFPDPATPSPTPTPTPTPTPGFRPLGYPDLHGPYALIQSSKLSETTLATCTPLIWVTARDSISTVAGLPCESFGLMVRILSPTLIVAETSGSSRPTVCIPPAERLSMSFNLIRPLTERGVRLIFVHAEKLDSNGTPVQGVECRYLLNGPTLTPRPTPTPAPAPAPTKSPTPSPSLSPRPTPRPTPSRSPSPSPGPTTIPPTATPTPSPAGPANQGATGIEVRGFGYPHLGVLVGGAAAGCLLVVALAAMVSTFIASRQVVTVAGSSPGPSTEEDGEDDTENNGGDAPFFSSQG